MASKTSVRIRGQRLRCLGMQARHSLDQKCSAIRSAAAVVVISSLRAIEKTLRRFECRRRVSAREQDRTPAAGGAIIIDSHPTLPKPWTASMRPSSESSPQRSAAHAFIPQAPAQALCCGWRGWLAGRIQVDPRSIRRRLVAHLCRHGGNSKCYAAAVGARLQGSRWFAGSRVRGCLFRPCRMKWAFRNEGLS